ncbi:phosphopentomutase [Desulfobacterales bacterium HSG17]|nr:phosphopentomutase [Desulfobacterales bacterium HSG17]
MRAIILIIDSFGIGALPDAADYGDTGANTALSICRAIGKPQWPNLESMGLGNCAALLDVSLPGLLPVEKPTTSFGVMAEKSPGKDTTTGHWELAGLILKEAFHTFPKNYPSFPAELVQKFEQTTGYEIIGNKAASGTAILEELGEAQMQGKRVIAYTSADSVFQIAAHEEIVPLQELYQICETARELCNPYQIARVIARPFIGLPGAFTRTKGRHDYSMDPPNGSLLDVLAQNNIETIGIGKIGDIFNQKGITQSFPEKGNPACIEKTLEVLRQKSNTPRLVFVNLVDTDMLFGHRRDSVGYHDAIADIDGKLPEIMQSLTPDDFLIITADHGCDPGFTGTDHTREYVPLLTNRPHCPASNLGIRESFADVAESITAFFGISADENKTTTGGSGTSFL